MSENQLIQIINQTPRMRVKWRQLSDEQKRSVLFIADGDDWNLDEILEDVLRDGTN
ncbi:MAG: hypothetical protein JO053_14455 [Acidobacteria bacterium]|nr:hypothetical protein [Acidobacteriota bacterium]